MGQAELADRWDNTDRSQSTRAQPCEQQAISEAKTCFYLWKMHNTYWSPFLQNCYKITVTNILQLEKISY